MLCWHQAKLSLEDQHRLERGVYYVLEDGLYNKDTPFALNGPVTMKQMARLYDKGEIDQNTLYASLPNKKATWQLFGYVYPPVLKERFKECLQRITHQRLKRTKGIDKVIAKFTKSWDEDMLLHPPGHVCVSGVYLLISK